MKSLLRTLLWIFLGLFFLSGIFKVLGFVLKITFGIIGLIMSFVWNYVLIPLLIVLLIVWLIGKFQKSR